MGYKHPVRIARPVVEDIDNGYVKIFLDSAIDRCGYYPGTAEHGINMDNRINTLIPYIVQCPSHIDRGLAGNIMPGIITMKWCILDRSSVHRAEGPKGLVKMSHYILDITDQKGIGAAAKACKIYSKEVS